MSDGRDRLIKLVGENTVRQYETENHYRLLCGELVAALRDMMALAEDMLSVATQHPDYLAALNAHGHDVAKGAFARHDKARAAIAKAEGWTLCPYHEDIDLMLENKEG